MKYTHFLFYLLIIFFISCDNTPIVQDCNESGFQIQITRFCEDLNGIGGDNCPLPPNCTIVYGDIRYQYISAAMSGKNLLPIPNPQPSNVNTFLLDNIIRSCDLADQIVEVYVTQECRIVETQTGNLVQIRLCSGKAVTKITYGVTVIINVNLLCRCI